METTNHTVLITGGSAGIGFEIARQLIEKGNRVIITGRDGDRLEYAAARLGPAVPIRCDVSDPAQLRALADRVLREFPSLDMVVNNAGRAYLYSLRDEGVQAYDKAEAEMRTNYFAVIRLNEWLLPGFLEQPGAAIVNVSSVVAFVPGSLATYSASKAALHSYSLSLRMALEDTSVKVFELMPPLVNTELSAPIGGARGIPPSDVATALVDALARDEYEIHVGNTANVYKAFLASPADALNLMRARTR